MTLALLKMRVGHASKNQLKEGSSMTLPVCLPQLVPGTSSSYCSRVVVIRLVQPPVGYRSLEATRILKRYTHAPSSASQLSECN
jgi:hypothetical protein